jgi:hypothetical protein
MLRPVPEAPTGPPAPFPSPAPAAWRVGGNVSKPVKGLEERGGEAGRQASASLAPDRQERCS